MYSSYIELDGCPWTNKVSKLVTNWGYFKGESAHLTMDEKASC